MAARRSKVSVNSVVIFSSARVIDEIRHLRCWWRWRSVVAALAPEVDHTFEAAITDLKRQLGVGQHRRSVPQGAVTR
jgi:hypothetical protein